MFYRLAYFAIVLLLCSPASAGWNMSWYDTAACSTASIGANFTEGLEGTGYENPAKITEDNGTPDEDYALPAALSGGCSQGIRFQPTDAGGEESIEINHGSVIDIDAGNVDFVFWLYLDTGIDVTTKTITISAIGDDGVADSGDNRINYNYNGTIHRIQATATTDSTFVTIVEDTWYKVTVHLDTTGANSYFQVEGGGSTTCDATSECTFTRVAALDFQYWHLGAPLGVEADEGCDMTIDLISY